MKTEAQREYIRLYRIKNRERISKSKRRYRATHAEEHRAENKRWAAKNKEKVREMARRSAKKNRAKKTAYQRQHRAQNREQYRAYDRKGRLKNRDTNLVKRRERYRQNNPPRRILSESERRARIAKNNAKYCAKLRERREAKKAQFLIDNPTWESDLKQQRAASRREKHNARCRRYNKIWRARNPEQYRARRNEIAQRYFQKRLREDVNFKIEMALRSRITGALKGRIKKTAKTVELLGCSIKNFAIYLESTFKAGMTLENHGAVWEIDHIIPCALFDLSRPQHQRSCFHFSNQQALFVTENRSKRAKVLRDAQIPLL